MFNKIKRIIRWIPILWNHYDFDYRSSLDVFLFSLEDLANFLDSDKTYTASAKANASSIRRLVKLQKAIYNGDIYQKIINNFEDKYGKVEFSFSEADEKGLRLMELSYPEIDGLTKEEVQELYSKTIKVANAKEEKAHKLFWRLLSNHIRGWWD
jgi:hypothetical protein